MLIGTIHGKDGILVTLRPPQLLTLSVLCLSKQSNYLSGRLFTYMALRSIRDAQCATLCSLTYSHQAQTGMDKRDFAGSKSINSVAYRVV